NVWRVCGPGVGGVVFALDVVKGLAPPLVGAALRLGSPWQILAALLAIVGHNYSVWLGFKGGKGIATSLGALLGVAPLVGLTAFGLFLVEIVTLRIVSVGSILGALSLPPLMLLYYRGDWYRFAFGVIACLMALYKHRANIQRLRAGTEPKLNLFQKQAKNPPAAEGPENPPVAVVSRDAEKEPRANAPQ
ncbi:MAG TPA: glycerol-3-phosphate acyltransferase, partial [Chthonomonadaceae bacterium]|nr:glycerol-3-phosphate acyltransferase [Chthonomonadaceae bacterium]